MKKLRNRRGETLIESLAAVLLVTIVMVGLCTAVASAARVNAKVRDTDVSFQYADGETPTTVNITVTENNATKDTFQANSYTAKNGYHYYQYQKQGAGS